MNHSSSRRRCDRYLKKYHSKDKQRLMDEASFSSFSNISFEVNEDYSSYLNISLNNENDEEWQKSRSYCIISLNDGGGMQLISDSSVETEREPDIQNTENSVTFGSPIRPTSPKKQTSTTQKSNVLQRRKANGATFKIDVSQGELPFRIGQNIVDRVNYPRTSSPSPHDDLAHSKSFDWSVIEAANQIYKFDQNENETRPDLKNTSVEKHSVNISQVNHASLSEILSATDVEACTKVEEAQIHDLPNSDLTFSPEILQRDGTAQSVSIDHVIQSDPRCYKTGKQKHFGKIQYIHTESSKLSCTPACRPIDDKDFVEIDLDSTVDIQQNAVHVVIQIEPKTAKKRKKSKVRFFIFGGLGLLGILFFCGVLTLYSHDWT